MGIDKNPHDVYMFRKVRKAPMMKCSTADNFSFTPGTIPGGRIFSSFFFFFFNFFRSIHLGK